MNIFKTFSLAGALLALSACDSVTIADFTLNPQRSFTLQTDKGAYKVGHAMTVRAKYNQSAGQLTLVLPKHSGQKLLEKRPRAVFGSVESASKTKIKVSAKKSGQGVGISMDAKFSHQTDGHRHTSQACTVRFPRTHFNCYRNKQGNQCCSHESSHGNHTVFQEYERDHYRYVGQFKNKSGARLANITGGYFTEKIVDSYPVSDCRGSTYTSCQQ